MVFALPAGDFLTTVGKLGFTLFLGGVVGATAGVALLAVTIPFCTAITGVSFATSGAVGFLLGAVAFALDAFFTTAGVGLAVTTGVALLGLALVAGFALAPVAGIVGVSVINGSCFDCGAVAFFSNGFGGVFVIALT